MRWRRWIFGLVHGVREILRCDELRHEGVDMTEQVRLYLPRMVTKNPDEENRVLGTRLSETYARDLPRAARLTTAIGNRVGEVLLAWSVLASVL